jgi:hypothetical protein
MTTTKKPAFIAYAVTGEGKQAFLNRPGFELTPRSWTNFKGSYGEVRDKVQARGR